MSDTVLSTEKTEAETIWTLLLRNSLSCKWDTHRSTQSQHWEMLNDRVMVVKHQVLRHIVGAHSGVIRIITYTQFRASREESLTKSFRKEGRQERFYRNRS